MKKEKVVTGKFSAKSSIIRAKETKQPVHKWSIQTMGNKYEWKTKMDRVSLIRAGLPYESIDILSRRINAPVKQMLDLFGLPQTTYNKKRREHSLLNGRDSEVVLILTELIDFGIEVFNNDENKFQRWLKKSNPSLGSTSPENLLDSITGIQEVKNCLNRLEYGNLA